MSIIRPPTLLFIYLLEDNKGGERWGSNHRHKILQKISLLLDYHLNCTSSAFFKGTNEFCLQPIFIRGISLRLILNLKDNSEVGVGADANS